MSDKLQETWEERCRDLKISPDCECIGEEVRACYDEWYGANNSSDRAIDIPPRMREDKPPREKGACDLITLHFRVRQDLTPEALTALEDLLLFVAANYDHSSNLVSFICQRFHITYNETHVILSLANKRGLLSHGGNACYSWISEKGDHWLKTRIPDEMERRTRLDTLKT